MNRLYSAFKTVKSVDPNAGNRSCVSGTKRRAMLAARVGSVKKPPAIGQTRFLHVLRRLTETTAGVQL